MDTKQRRRISPEMKKAVLLEILKDQNSVSEVAERHSLAPSQIYTWQNEAFSRLHHVFDDPKKDRKVADAEKERLKAQLKDKETFATELLEEYTKLKKSLGQSW